MSKGLSSGRHLLLTALGVWIAGCSLESDLLSRTGNSAPVNDGVTISGAGTRDESDAAVFNGDASRITDIHDSSNGGNGGDGGTRRVSVDAMPGGTDSGGAFDESAGDIAGAAASDSGASGAGGEAGSTAGEGSATSPTKAPPTLWFSEYVEGSSSNKALEITAKARSALDGCKVGSYFNGKTEATVVATLSGVLEAGKVFTLCTSTLKEKLPTVCNQVGNLTFNGDDVVALSCDGRLLDVIGQIGVDPGEGWGSTVDHTLRRNCSVQSGDPLGSDPFDPNTQCQVFPTDTFDGLGIRGC